MKTFKDKVGDAWKNILTGMGLASRDKQVSNTFGVPAILTESVVADLYRGDGFGKRVVNLPTGEMVREWIEIAGDTEGDIVKYISTTLQAKKHFLQTLRWDRIYGGAVLLMGINDGGKFEDPLNEANIKEVEFLKSYDRYRVTWNTTDLYNDPNTKKHNTPEYYTINPIGLGTSQPFKVHETRCLVFEGEPVTDRQRQENQGWGDSYYQGIWTQLSHLGGAYFSSKAVMDEFIQTIIKMENLAEMLAAGNDELIKERINIIDLSKHIINSVILDSKEDYERKASNVSGLANLLIQFALAVSAVTGIPYALLMGQSPKGFDSKEEGITRFWYDSIASEQEAKLKTPLERFIYLVMLSKQGPTKGQIIEDWAVNFKPLWQPSLKEKIDTRKTQADIDVAYVHAGVVEPEEVCNSRFGGDEYSHETECEERAILSEDDRKTLEQENREFELKKLETLNKNKGEGEGGDPGNAE